MKRMEIVVEASRLDAFIAVIGKHATGYTLLPNAAGLGEHGYRERDMVVLVTVVTEDHLDAIIEGLGHRSMSARASFWSVTCRLSGPSTSFRKFAPPPGTARRKSKLAFVGEIPRP